MPSMDATAKAALAADFAVAWFIFLDIAGDPLRVTTHGADITFSSTGDSDLDGNTFVAFGGQLVEVGDAANSESGSDTLTVTLSGIVSIDTTLINEIGDLTKWQGRTCRIWFALYDPTGTTQQGAVVPHYTGYMSAVDIALSPEQQVIQLKVENYIAAFNDASNRTYLGQKDYDSGDNSAQATLAAANAARHHGGGANGAPGTIPTGPSSGGSYRVGPGMGGPGLNIY